MIFSFSKNILSFPADKLTTGTYSFVSFILNAAPVELLIVSTSGAISFVALLVNTQFLDQVKPKLDQIFRHCSPKIG